MREFYNKYREDIKECFNDIKKKNIKKQIPNMLTASRLFAPFFIIPAAFSGNLILASLFTLLFELTDAFDGYAARKLNVVSEFGKDLDPIVDKIFATTMSIPVIAINPVMLVNIGLEGAIAVVNTKSKLKGNVPRTTVLGKFKTLMMSLSLILSYITIATNSINTAVLSSILGLTAVIQLATAKQYFNIDIEKDVAKLENYQRTAKTEIVEETKLDKVKKYTRATEVSELKKLKEELLNQEIVKEKENVKTKK